jgi:hypothetical protein
VKTILAIILCSFLSTELSAQKEATQIKSAIDGFFNGLSLVNADTIKHYVTTDFHLLEDGEIWNTDTLLHKILPGKNANIKRVNAFEYARMEQTGNIAWVSYYNTAVFSRGDKSKTVKWLESAVLVREGGRWKIQMLHSTPIE